MSRRWVIPLVLAIAGIAVIVFGVQVLSQEHGPDPGGKVFVASWLDSELWVHPWLLLLGLAMLAASVTLLLLGPRLRRGSSPRRVSAPPR